MYIVAPKDGAVVCAVRVAKGGALAVAVTGEEFEVFGGDVEYALACELGGREYSIEVCRESVESRGLLARMMGAKE